MPKRVLGGTSRALFLARSLMINIIVHLHTILQKETPGGLVNRMELQLPGGSTTVLTVLEELDIELSPEALLVAINGRVVDESHILEEGDRLDLMPAISGGQDAQQLSAHLSDQGQLCQ